MGWIGHSGFDLRDGMMGEATLNYRVVGSGPPLLLVHGFGVSFNIWRALAPLLVDRFQLVMIELPGIGGSPPSGDGVCTAATIAAIESVRQKLGIPKWAVLGYSSGVSIAAAYVSAYPQQTDAVVLLCPPLLNYWRWRSLRALFWLDNWQPAAGDWVLTGWRIYWLVALLGFNGRPNSLTEEWIEEIRSQPLPILKAVVRELPPAHQLLAGNDETWLLVCGQYDLVSTRPPKTRARVAFFAGDHSGPVQMADPIAATIIKFLIR